MGDLAKGRAGTWTGTALQAKGLDGTAEQTSGQCLAKVKAFIPLKTT